jgi:hypothetical protein
MSKITASIVYLSVTIAAADLVQASPLHHSYPLTVHVRVSESYNSVQHIYAFVNDEKYELIANAPGVFDKGDYSARLVKDEHNIKCASERTYELLLPNNKTQKFRVAGTFDVTSFIPFTPAKQ